MRDTPLVGPAIPVCSHGLHFEFTFGLSISSHLTPTLKSELAEQLLSEEDASSKQEEMRWHLQFKVKSARQHLQLHELSYFENSIVHHQACTLQGSISQQFPSFQPHIDFQTAVLITVLKALSERRVTESVHHYAL